MGTGDLPDEAVSAQHAELSAHLSGAAALFGRSLHPEHVSGPGIRLAAAFQRVAGPFGLRRFSVTYCRFHCAMTRVSRSYPSFEMLAVPSAK
jgi:hypothetical protein